MQVGLIARRTQYSSCDGCRKSRVACDAMRDEALKSDHEALVPCTRCLTRQKPCTFKVGVYTEQQDVADKNGKWMQNALQPKTKKTSRAKRLTRSQAHSPVLAQTSSRSSISLESHSHETHENEPAELAANDVQWLQSIYRDSFEIVFGSWMGKYSCPFSFVSENAPTGDVCVSISDLCRRLDQWMADQSDLGYDDKRDQKISASLQSTIAAFSARWLPVTSQVAIEHIQSLWRYARRDTLKIINRPSYRSMLSLLLFALTPIPTGILEEEEEDGMTAQAAVQVALQQIQSLRARQRNLQFNGAKVSPSDRARTMSVSPNTIETSNFINAENVAYWAALTFDTSASLTLNCRSLLSSGLFGIEGESSWRLVRACRKMFEEETEQWKTRPDMTNERANHIIAAGAAWKLMGWKLTAVFKEALRDGHAESEVTRAYSHVVDSIHQFNTTYRSLLESCQKRMQFFGQETKLRWYSLMLHYHLSILMLTDIIEASDRHDLLLSLTELNADAETTVLNTLVFGLHNTYRLSGQEEPITVSLIAIDPYPHHVVAAVRLVRKAIDRDFLSHKISGDVYKSLKLTLKQSVDHLPQSSKSVQAAADIASDV